MWIRTQTRGWVNSEVLLSIGLGTDAAGRSVVIASLPAPGPAGIATAPLAGPFLDEDRAAAAAAQIVARVAKGAVLDPAAAG